MQSDSLVNRAVLDAPVLPVEFVPASVVSLDGFLLIRRRAKRKCARTFENSDIGSSDDLDGVGSFSPGIVAMLIIVRLMIAILPVVKTVRP